MGPGLSKTTEITKAENVSKESLNDSSTSFSVLNIHGASSAGRALMVVGVLVLACLGYSAARYQDYVRKVRHRAAMTLDIVKPACPV